jgi:TPR repeat protein
MRYALYILQILLLFSVAEAKPVHAAKRVALLVGINDYENVPKLQKANADAAALGALLRRMDFDVAVVTDPDRKGLVRALADLRNRARNADTVLIHFSGHGVVIGGENYMLPKDVSKPGTDAELVQDEALSQTELVRKLAAPAGEKRTVIVIIDACRDSPYAAPDRPLFGAKGLARVEPPEGVFIMYSAGFGQTALDSLGPDDKEPTSVYTRALMAELGKPGRTLIDIANDTRAQVRDLALTISHAQTPAFYDQVDGRKIILLPEPEQPPASEPATAPVGDDDEDQGTKAQEEQVAAIVPKVPLPQAGITECDRTGGLILDFDAVSKTPPQPYNADAAIKACRSAVEGDPLKRRFHAYLGNALRMKGDFIGARESLQRAVGMGSVVAHNELAVLYMSGAGVPRDDGEAVRLLKLAADQGFGVAMANLARMYRDGRGVLPNDAEAVRLYKLAMEKGVIGAAGGLGVMYKFGRAVPQNNAEAYRLLKQAADVGVTEGMVALGDMYEKGLGMSPNPAEAARLYAQAHQKGDSQGAVALGALHFSGRGVPQSHNEATRLFTLAAQSGNNEARVWLGFMNERGIGFAQNFLEAIRWYKMAADAGDPQGMAFLAEMYDFGRGVPQNIPEALNLYRTAVNKGNARAMYYLGDHYERGVGVPVDVQQAAQLYTRSAELGYVDAELKVGTAYMQGRGVVKDYNMALKYLTKAADKGSAGGAHSLGIMYDVGMGVAQDHSRAATLYKTAADRGWIPALADLGWLHMMGKGVPKNSFEAARLLTLGANQGSAYAMYYLGQLHEKGDGVERNAAKSAEYILKGAARHDHVLTMLFKGWNGFSLPVRKAMQSDLKSRGLYTGRIDGRAGNVLAAALNKMRDLAKQPVTIGQAAP